MFSHPQTATAHPTAVGNQTAYGSLFLEPDLPAGTESELDDPEFAEPTREFTVRPRRDDGRRPDVRRRTNRRRTAA